MDERWEFEVSQISPIEIKECCDRDLQWQQFKRSLEKYSTKKRLHALRTYRTSKMEFNGGKLPRRVQVQIDYCIIALQREGRLDQNGNIRQ